LLFAEKGLFGKKCVDILQYLNADEEIVRNCIQFEDSTSFLVDGRAVVDVSEGLEGFVDQNQ